MWQVASRCAVVGLVVATGVIAVSAKPPEPILVGPALQDIREAFGHTMDSPKVRAVACAFRGHEPTAHFPSWQVPADELKLREIYASYQWKSKGFAMEFDREDMAGADWQLASVWMFDQDIRGFARYRGELPDGLTFGATRASVEKRLGTPKFVLPGVTEEPWRGGGRITHTLFKRTGVAVSYFEQKGKEPVVAAVAMFQPDSAPHWW